jgi:hypothetical protein
VQDSANVQLEGPLRDEQLRRLLELADLTQSDGARAVAVRPPDGAGRHLRSGQRARRHAQSDTPV